MKTDYPPFIRGAIRLAETVLRRPLRRPLSGATRGQSLVEFSLVAVVLFPFLFVLILFMFNLAQSWSLGHAVDNLGQRIITTGQFDQTAFINDTSSLGFPSSSTNTHLSIVVTNSAGSSTTFTWGSNLHDGDTVTFHYGDLVTIESTKQVNLGEFAKGLIDLLPTTEVSWSGVAQRDSP